MKVKLAEKTGFCFGVKRAVGMAEAALAKKGKISSLGSIIHNKQVVRDLSKKGLKVVRNASGIKSGTVIISSHGLSPKVAEAISARGVKIIDSTCPFVLKAQGIARSLSNEGYKVVIVGDKGHPEVRALVDFITKEKFVVKDAKEAKALRIGASDRVGVISQTTQSTANFLKTVEAILERCPNELRVFNTICNDAGTRQEAAKALARKVDLMIVIGGKDSANTRRLFEVSKGILKNSRLVETDGELKARWLNKARAVGITSGASTPDWIIKRVATRLNSKRKSQTSKLKAF